MNIFTKTFLGRSSAAAACTSGAIWCFATFPNDHSTKVNAHGRAELRQVVVIHRHGDRTPINDIGGALARTEDDVKFWSSLLPSDSDVEDLYRGWSFDESKLFKEESASGLLTRRGVQQLHALGTNMRKRYVDQLGFLPEILPENASMHIRSTVISRCVQSALALQSGLYPKDARERLGHGKSHATVILGETDRDSPKREPMWPQNRSCQRQQELYSVLKKDRPMELKVARTKLEREALDVLGLSKGVKKLNLGAVMEVVHCSLVHGKKNVPISADETFVERLGEVEAKSRTSTFHNHESLKLAVGRLLVEIVDQMEEAAAGSGKKFVQFSGHDSTVIPLRFALGLEPVEWPPYAANIVIELWHDASVPGEHFINILYNGKIEYTMNYNEFLEDKIGDLLIGDEEYLKVCST
eukprot:g4133.t1